MMLTDTHAHLDFPEFESDLPEVLRRAAAAGVQRIITIGTDLASSRRAIQIASRHPGVFATVGLHPGSVQDERELFARELEELAKHPKVVAIGETGLDYYRLPSRLEKEDIVQTALQSISTGSVQLEIRDEAVKAAQAGAFEQQLELAARLDKPVVVHQRDSWADTLAIIRRYPVRAVFHCFNGGPEQAFDVLALGHEVSFTGIVTFKNAASVHAAATELDLDRFMVETDSPYLAPVPHRGKRCEPAYVRDTAEAIARLRKIPLAELADRTSANAERFFRLTPETLSA